MIRVTELEGLMNSNGFPQASSIMCSLSQDVEGIQMVKLAAKHVRNLVPQVQLLLDRLS